MPNTTSTFRDAAARHVLRGLHKAGIYIAKRARSAHGSDCSCDEGHTQGPMGRCRCLRVMRLRGASPKVGDWLLIFGDCQEGGTVQLQGPYTPDTPLYYGGGFWERVEV